jgi:hypothetical protein
MPRIQVSDHEPVVASHTLFFSADEKFVIKQFKSFQEQECKDELDAFLNAYKYHLTPSILPVIYRDVDFEWPVGVKPSPGHFYLVMQKWGSPLTPLLQAGETEANQKLLRKVRNLLEVAREHGLDVDLHSDNILVDGDECRLIDIQKRLDGRSCSWRLTISERLPNCEEIDISTDPPTWVQTPNEGRRPGETFRAYAMRRAAERKQTRDGLWSRLRV